MKHSILLILVFAGLARCALIPNKRVIVYNDDPDDYTLVEGVPYNIVHLKSRMKLNGDNYDVDVKNLNSYWSIQKAYDSLYNIIHLNSCRNLDSNSRKVYTSTPEYNNHYQHWEFTKLKNDTYNIKHPISQSRSLDSNSYSVYLGNEYKHYNPFQQWSFEPANYNLTALVTEFSYPPDLKDQMGRYKKRTNLLLGNITIKNPTNATITTSIDRIEKKLNSYTVEIRKAEFLGKKVSNRLSIFFHINAIVYEWLGINTGIDWNRGAERQFVSQHEEIYKETISEEVTYGIKEQIMVPPFNSIEFGATIDQITVDIPFNATIRITGKADRLDEYGNVVPMTDVDIDALKCYLQKENYSIIKVVAEENYLIVSTNGTLKVDGYGLASTIETKPIFHDNPPDSNDLPTDFGDILWQYRQFIYFAGAFVIYKFGRKFFENRNYVEI